MESLIAATEEIHLREHKSSLTVENEVTEPLKPNEELKEQEGAIGTFHQHQQCKADDPDERREPSKHIWHGRTPQHRQIYPNYFFSPFTSPMSSPAFNRRTNFKESQRISIEKLGEHIQLNQYRLKERIGQGSYGIVKLAYNEIDDKHYAMKILSKKKLLQRAGLFGRRAPARRACSKGLNENPLSRAYREIAILKKLDHPNVVNLVEVLDDPACDDLYLVFELLERGEILQIPTTEPLSEDVARQYFRDVLMGIEYLHYQKIVHCDIKPSNLLVSDENRIKIADFGICNEFYGDDDSLRANTYGTPAFISPEAVSNLSGKYSGKAADIWQLGITLFTLVCGHVPFCDRNIVNLYTRIQVEDLVFPKKPVISNSLKDLILKMLLKNPNQRIVLSDIKDHEWITSSGKDPLPSEEENCKSYIEVTEEDVLCCVQSIPKLDTLILVKTMLKHHSFQHPFKKRSQEDPSTPHLQERSFSAPNSCDFYYENHKNYNKNSC